MKKQNGAVRLNNFMVSKGIKQTGLVIDSIYNRADGKTLPVKEVSYDNGKTYQISSKTGRFWTKK